MKKAAGTVFPAKLEKIHPKHKNGPYLANHIFENNQEPIGLR